MRIRHPRAIGLLFSTLLTLIFIEFGLRIFDPYGIERYYADMSKVYSSMIADDTRGYQVTPGSYAFSNWQAVINPDGNRAVPDTAKAGCTIAFLGDSVTYGFGVSDDETWVNLIAQQFPTVRFINTGVVGYNIQQAAATLDKTPADGYLYLMITNDAEPMLQPSRAIAQSSFIDLVTRDYVWEWYRRQMRVASALPDYTAFDATWAALRQHGNLITVGFTNDNLALRAGVPRIDPWTNFNSWLDQHANPAGNQQIASELQPFVARLIKQVC